MTARLMIATAALLASSAAFAQVGSPGAPATAGGTGAMAVPPAATETMGPSAGGTSGMSASEAPSGSSADGTVGSTTTTDTASGSMTQVGGKWMVGDRPATRSEIAAHKKAMKSSKPM